MLGLGDPLRSNGFGMMQNLVADFALVQKIDELFRDFHERLHLEHPAITPSSQ
jgi:hypothetical protein